MDEMIRQPFGLLGSTAWVVRFRAVRPSFPRIDDAPSSKASRWLIGLGLLFMLTAKAQGAAVQFYGHIDGSGLLTVLIPDTYPADPGPGAPYTCGTYPSNDQQSCNSSYNWALRETWPQAMGLGGATANGTYYENVFKSSGGRAYDSTKIIGFYQWTLSGCPASCVWSTPPPPPPAASFDFAPSSPKVAQTVQFTDTSSGSPTSWSWTFGDGGTTSVQNPTHAYAAAASYSVTLTATNAGGSDSETKTVTVTVPSPVANFSWFPTSPNMGQEIQFTDISTGVPTSWSWTFGDGGASTAQNPKHTYVTAGSFDVTLSATNAAGSNFITKTLTIVAPPGAPTANFTYSPSPLKAGQEIQFSDTSAGSPTSWAWTFGDGATSGAQHPKHTFGAAGSYAVTLTATNAAASDWETKTLTVVPAATAPVADFSWTPSSPASGQEVQFSDTSTGGPSSWSWTFGDGGTSSARNPKRTFGTAGSYSVTLTATNAAGSNARSRTVTVTTVTELVADFVWTPTSPTAGEQVQFSDTSTGSPLSWAWTFGDGGTSTSRNPKHTFVSAGTYAVELTVTNSAGSSGKDRSVAISGSACPHSGWSDLNLPTTDMGRELEAFRGDVPDGHPTLFAPMIDHVLDGRVADLNANVLASASTARFTRESGLRPSDYQAHLYRIKTLYEAMYKVRGTNVAELCSLEIAGVDAERIKHGLRPRKPNGVEMPGTLAVNQHSNHEFGTALDVSVTNIPSTWKTLLSQNRLLEPCQEAAIHLQVKENPICGASATITAAAYVPTSSGTVMITTTPLVPIRILVRDSAGRRIGYEPSTGTIVNDIGESASYSGLDSDPQIVTIEDAKNGDYRVEAIAVSSGPYTIVISADDAEHDATIISRTRSGNAVTGDAIEPVVLEVQNTTTQPGRRRSVRH